MSQRRRLPKPTINRLGIPVPTNGNSIAYLTLQDPKYYDLMMDIANGLYEELGITETRLLNNYAMLQYYTVQFYPDSRLERNLNSVIDEISEDVHNIFRLAISRSEFDQIKIHKHKMSNPGPPLLDQDGIPYSTKDVVYGFEKNIQNPITFLLKDYSSVKQACADRFLDDVIDRQFKTATYGVERYLIENIEARSQSVAMVGARMNSIDKIVTDVSNNCEFKMPYKKQIVAGKSRNCSVLTEKGVIHGEFDIDKYARDYSGLYPMGFGPHRKREVRAAGFLANINPQLYQQMIMTSLENSAFGFLSNSDSCKRFTQDYFDSHCEGEFVAYCADRVNNEMFVTANVEQYIQLHPPEFQDILRVMLSQVLITDNGLRFVEGLISGFGATTVFNVTSGLEATASILSALLNARPRQISNALWQCYYHNTPYFKYDRFLIRPFLPTDDVPGGIRGPIDKLNFKAAEEYCDKNQSKLEYGDEIVSFGMRFGFGVLQEAIDLQYSKAPFCESPGFAAKDIFSIGMKTGALSYAARKVFDKAFRKHCGVETSWYASRMGMFIKFLQELGLNPEDQFNMHNPIEELYRTRLVQNIDPLSATDKLSHPAIHDLFSYYKRNVRAVDNLSQQGSF